MERDAREWARLLAESEARVARLERELAVAMWQADAVPDGWTWNVHHDYWDRDAGGVHLVVRHHGEWFATAGGRTVTNDNHEGDPLTAMEAADAWLAEQEAGQ